MKHRKTFDEDYFHDENITTALKPQEDLLKIGSAEDDDDDSPEVILASDFSIQKLRDSHDYLNSSNHSQLRKMKSKKISSEGGILPSIDNASLPLPKASVVISGNYSSDLSSDSHSLRDSSQTSKKIGHIEVAITDDRASIIDSFTLSGEVTNYLEALNSSKKRTRFASFSQRKKGPSKQFVKP